MPSENAPDWSYARDSLMEVPEGQRIERHGHELIYRALATGRTVAFVGSGASMAYGRLSWRDLVQAAQSEAVALGEIYKNRSAAVNGALTLLKQQQVTDSADTSPQSYPIMFQLAEQIHQLVGRVLHNDTARKFRENVTEDIRDDFGHVKNMIETINRDVSHGSVPGGKQGAFGIPTKLQELPAEGDAGDIRSGSSFGKFLGISRGYIESADATYLKLRCLHGLLERYESQVLSGRRFLPPYHRFMISIAMRLCALGASPSEIADCKRFWNQDARYARRGDLLGADRDPLLLVSQLRVTRFLTTNFDREIERLLEDEGYRATRAVTDTSVRRRDDPLGRPLREVVFDRNHTAHLLAFAARSRGEPAEVVHLHGVARPDGPLIITEGDYQARYLADDERRGLMDDAIAAAFGSSPVLFIGSGFSEDDLLRPLRHFFGNGPRSRENIAVALVPAYEKRSSRDGSKIQNLQRFGVYTIHYGQENNAGIPHDSVWLEVAHDLRNKLLSALHRIVQVCSSDRTAGRDGSSVDLASLGALAIENPSELEGISVSEHPDLSIETEVELLKCAREFVVTIAPKMQGKTYERKKKIIRQVALIHRVAVQGAMDSITGAFLCAKLISLRTSSDQDRKQWFTAPVPVSSVRYVDDWRWNVVPGSGHMEIL